MRYILAALMLLGPVASANPCQFVKQKVVAVVTPVVAVAAVPVLVPTYAVSYNGTADELLQLRQEIALLRAELAKQRPGPAPGPAPAPGPGPNPPPFTAQPQADPPHLTVFKTANCASCHGSAMFREKGKGFRMFEQDGSLKKLTAEERLKILQRMRGSSKSGPQMPLRGRPATDEEYSTVVNGLLEAD